MASDPTSSSRQRLTGLKARGWFLGALFARLIAADVSRGVTPDDARLAQLLDVARKATALAAPEIENKETAE